MKWFRGTPGDGWNRKLFTDCSLTAANRPAATVPNVEYLHGFTFDGEGANCCLESHKPALTRVSRLLRLEPVEDGGDVALSLIR